MVKNKKKPSVQITIPEKINNTLRLFNDIAQYYCPNSKVVFRDYKGFVAGRTSSKILKGEKIYEIRVPKDVRRTFKKILDKQGLKMVNEFGFHLSILLHEIAHIVLGHVDKKDSFLDKSKKRFERKLEELENQRQKGTLTQEEWQKLANKAYFKSHREIHEAHPSRAHTDKNNRFRQNEIEADKWVDEQWKHFAKLREHNSNK